MTTSLCQLETVSMKNLTRSGIQGALYGGMASCIGRDVLTYSTL